MPNRKPRNWREVFFFWFELSAVCTEVVREEKKRGACREPRTPPGPGGPACPRIALGSRRGRDQPRRPRERTACGARPLRLLRRVASRRVPRCRWDPETDIYLPYRSRERTRRAWRDEHRVRVRDGRG